MINPSEAGPRNILQRVAHPWMWCDLNRPFALLHGAYIGPQLLRIPTVGKWGTYSPLACTAEWINGIMNG